MNIRDRWHQLSLREQRVALFGLSLFAILLYYFLVYAPLSESIKESQERFKSNTELLGWMRQAEAQLKTATQSTQALKDSPGSLLTTIEQSIKGSPLESISPEIKQLQTNQVQITIPSIQFDQLLNWLEKLSKEYRLTIAKITLKRAPEEGIVSSTIVVSH